MGTVVIVGGGAAGMLAGIAAAMSGSTVHIYEKNEKLGKKVYITGKGRCNVTNACDTEDLLKNVVSNPKFLYSSFYGFTNFDMMELLEGAGCKLKTERGNRVFPVSDKSSDVIKALTNRLKSLGAVSYTHLDVYKRQEEHCKKAPELLAEIGAEPELVHAIVCHGYGLCSDVEPEHELEKVLFAADELTGLIGAAARLRPSKSVMDMEVSSLKKKYKDKRFAAGCSREVIAEGAERLGWTLEELFDKTIQAMRSCEASINEEMEKLEAGLA